LASHGASLLLDDPALPVAGELFGERLRRPFVDVASRYRPVNPHFVAATSRTQIDGERGKGPDLDVTHELWIYAGGWRSHAWAQIGPSRGDRRARFDLRTSNRTREQEHAERKLSKPLPHWTHLIGKPTIDVSRQSRIGRRRILPSERFNAPPFTAHR